MATLALRRHAMPAVTLAAWLGAVLAAGLPHRPGGTTRLAAGLALLVAAWLVEWRGIAGVFENRVPRHPLVAACRALWLAGLVVAAVDGATGRWTPAPAPWVWPAGLALALSGVGLRLWSMRTLAGAFSYDVKVAAGQELVRRGPYRLLRHPAYTGMLLWSAALGVWNPSLPGLALLLTGTLPQLVYRIAVEERLLAAHFGERWRAHARATARLVPFVW